ncbi:MAG TPA: FMN-binding negative transcriptional regulator [Ferruginibacter sp.]|nr:FMN-binding negative transcriptional regulator [Ferruginibacter sp.]HRE64148.1 FMN-binding negative transcriptional regulator [Ferruginibacter sp.]
MYKLPYYTEHNNEVIINFMKQQSFAFVTGIGETFPVVTQLPLEVVEEGDKLFLLGHLMRNTDHHKAFEKNNKVLVIFHSPHAYINANWYSNPAQGSTVNYISVHAKGIIQFLEEAGTRAAVEIVTNRHIGKGTAASFENISEEYIDTMVKAIIGFKIEVSYFENVFKLSQNRNAEDYSNIIEQLEARANEGDIYIATKMKERIK